MGCRFLNYNNDTIETECVAMESRLPACNSLLSYIKLKDKTQPEVVEPAAGRVVVAIGGPAVAGVAVPAAATVHAARA